MERREPWARPGGTTFHFVNGGIEDALRRAKAAAGGGGKMTGAGMGRAGLRGGLGRV